jgi:hypothetical protein
LLIQAIPSTVHINRDQKKTTRGKEGTHAPRRSAWCASDARRLRKKSIRTQLPVTAKRPADERSALKARAFVRIAGSLAHIN